MYLTSVPLNSRGRLLPVDTTAVISSSSGTYTIWDAACKVQSDHTVDAIVCNTTHSEVKLSAQRSVRYFKYQDELQTRDLNKLFIDEICSLREASKDCGPHPAPSQADQYFICQNVAIAAPDTYKEQYISLLTKYHDVISKGKFDLGWTVSIQHKMPHKDPVHIKQFLIPLELQQQI